MSLIDLESEDPKAITIQPNQPLQFFKTSEIEPNCKCGEGNKSEDSFAQPYFQDDYLAFQFKSYELNDDLNWDFDIESDGFQANVYYGFCGIEGEEGSILTSAVFTPGKHYRIVMNVDSMTMGELTVKFGQTIVGVISHDGEYIFTGEMSAGGITVRIIKDSDFDGCVTIYTIKELCSSFSLLILDKEGNLIDTDETGFDQNGENVIYYKKFSELELADGCYNFNLCDLCNARKFYKLNFTQLIGGGCISKFPYTMVSYTINGEETVSGQVFTTYQEEKEFYQSFGFYIDTFQYTILTTDVYSFTVSGCGGLSVAYQEVTNTECECGRELLGSNYEIDIDASGLFSFSSFSVTILGVEHLLEFTPSKNLTDLVAALNADSYFGTLATWTTDGSIIYIAGNEEFIIESMDINDNPFSIGDFVTGTPPDSDCIPVPFTNNIALTADDESCKTKLLQWQNRDNAFGFDFEDFPNFVFNLRVEAQFQKPKYPEEIEPFDYSDGKEELIYANTRKSKILAISGTGNGVPEYIHDAIWIGRRHDAFAIDGLAYVVTKGEYQPIWRQENNSDLANSEIEVTRTTQLFENSFCSS